MLLLAAAQGFTVHAPVSVRRAMQPSAVNMQHAAYDTPQGYGAQQGYNSAQQGYGDQQGYGAKQGYASPVVLSVAGFNGVTGFAYSMSQNDRYLHLPYDLRNGENQVLSRWNMQRQKLTVSREQSKVQVSTDGTASLFSCGRGPTMWRSKFDAVFPCGPWQAIYKNQMHVLSDGDQISLDCNDPDDAVFTCHVAGAMGQSAHAQQQDQQGYAQQQGCAQQQGYAPPPQGYAQGLPPGWTSGIDQASGATYYYHEQTGQSQWEYPQ